MSAFTKVASVKIPNKIPNKIPKKSIPKTVRKQVWDVHIGHKYQGKCFVFKSRISVFSFECGHIVSRYEGGSCDVSNLRPICSLCNKSMGTKNLTEFKKEHFPNKNCWCF